MQVSVNLFHFPLIPHGSTMFNPDSNQPRVNEACVSYVSEHLRTFLTCGPSSYFSYEQKFLSSVGRESLRLAKKLIAHH